MRIMQNFDQSIASVLGEKVKARMSFKVHTSHSPRRASKQNRAADWYMQGHLDTYRFCDEVWTFIIKDIKFKLENAQQLDVEKVKIVACLAKDKAA